ncbi:MAG: enoyl-CoA hydratase-related protein, partial [Thermoleophilaceae bacterium]
MELLETLTYERDGRIARITLNRPERGNGITLAMPRELAECVERANLDPEVHVIALAGNGTGFCGGYDLVQSAEGMGTGGFGDEGDPRRLASRSAHDRRQPRPFRHLGPGHRLPDDVAQRARLHEPVLCNRSVLPLDEGRGAAVDISQGFAESRRTPGHGARRGGGHLRL